MINIVNKVDCCGCSACSSICPKQCIKMLADEEGFLYPVVDENTCIKCDICERVCPILNHKKNELNSSQKGVIVQNRNEEICNQSTAGGAFTPIAEYVVDQGGIVFGVEMQKDYSVKHIGVETSGDLFKFRNSKYVQSDVSDSYKQVQYNLKCDRLVCFSGTPCQIEGLLHYLGKDYENLILVDVVCRAVPSPGVWKKYIEMEIKKRGKIQSVRFRDKTLGYQYSTMELKAKDGKVYRGGVESQPWLRMFFSGMIIRPSCTDCKFRSRYRRSDFTIWDCFNSYSIDKSFDENIGTTRMLIHTEKGERIFKQIRNEFNYREISVEKLISGVKEMSFSPEINPKRKEFYRDYLELSMDELIKKYFPENAKVKFKKYIRLILNRLGLDKVVKHILKKG